MRPFCANLDRWPLTRAGPGEHWYLLALPAPKAQDGFQLRRVLAPADRRSRSRSAPFFFLDPSRSARHEPFEGPGCYLDAGKLAENVCYI